MIRSKTTLVVGAGAGCELEMPDGKDMLNKIAQGFDFSRLGSDLQTRDMLTLAKHYEALGQRAGTSGAKLQEGAGRIRTSVRVGTSIDAILEQHSQDPLVIAAGKMAIAYYTLQSEAGSPMGVEPRDAGDLPLRGAESWLFQLGRIIVGGIPRHKAEHCFDNLNIICFNYDRSLQHYLPFVLQMAFGMSLDEARQLVGAKLNITHPYGRAGRLPWEPGESPAVEWGDEETQNLANLIAEIKVRSERMADPDFVARLHRQVADAKKLVFLGFGFDPQNMDFLLDSPLNQETDILAAITGIGDTTRLAIEKMLRGRTGISDPDLVSVLDTRCFQLLRDNSILLES